MNSKGESRGYPKAAATKRVMRFNSNSLVGLSGSSTKGNRRGNWDLVEIRTSKKKKTGEKNPTRLKRKQSPVSWATTENPKKERNRHQKKIGEGTKPGGRKGGSARQKAFFPTGSSYAT